MARGRERSCTVPGLVLVVHCDSKQGRTISPFELVVEALDTNLEPFQRVDPHCDESDHAERTKQMLKEVQCARFFGRRVVQWVRGWKFSFNQ